MMQNYRVVTKATFQKVAAGLLLLVLRMPLTVTLDSRNHGRSTLVPF